MITGFVAVVVGSLLRSPMLPWMRSALVLVVAVVVAGRELGLYPLRLPQNRRQVPPSVIFDGGRVGALRFGFEMGTGVRTFMTSGLPHVAVLAVALLASFPAALLAGAAFGAGRAVMPLSRLHWREPDEWDELLSRFRYPLGVVLLAAVAVSLIPVALG
jgi:hypothetical protein